ncbi:hypothetical protein HYFRA_00010112 [Hymenoscyphus fraxineus]|uniref:Uncharacterized protein n=1 Tax=Hymenoscyphus fraxineus TaxID=746836 RepID=A0A9N9KW06_9HELO|nr:hypothetical protein HYFRA_00010112 [Hymenoscyphus fraxineus]
MNTRNIEHQSPTQPLPLPHSPDDEPPSTSWWRTNLPKAILSLLGLQILWFIRKAPLGAWYYHLEFVRALLGNPPVDGACERLRRVERPWEELGEEGWYRLQRCRGGDDGWCILESFGYLFGFTAVLGPGVTFLALAIAGWYLVTHGPRRLDQTILTLRRIPQETWIGISGVSALLSIFALWLYFPLNAFLHNAIPLAVITLLLTIYHISTETQGILVIVRPVVRFVVLVLERSPWFVVRIKRSMQHVVTSVYYMRSCHHVWDCTCPTVQDLDALYRELEDSREAIRLEKGENRSLRRQMERLENEVLVLNDFPHSRRGGQTERRRSVLPTSPSSPTAANKQRIIEQLQDVVMGLERQVDSQGRQYERRILNLKSQLEYAQGDGNALQTQEEADRLRALVRTREKEINLATHQAMKARLELENERNTTGSRACKNEASCQLIIQKLTREKEVLLERHAANDRMVQQAAREFGKSEEESSHYTVRSYLQELTQAMVQQIAAGGLGGIKNQPVFSNILSNMDKIRLRELEMYKNRLEDEVERLGGNLQFVKMGLNIRLPPRKLLHYKDFASDVFDVYLGLCEKVGLFTDVFLKDLGPYGLLPWTHPQPRNEVGNRRFHFHVLDMFDQQFKMVKNLKYEQFERLIHSLLHQEVARLFGRLMDLKKEAVEKSKHALSPMSIQLLEGKRLEIKHTINSALQIMSDDREVEKTTLPLSDPLNGTRPEPRYKIWKAMQESITHLQTASLTFNTPPPPWRIPKDITPPSFTPTKTLPALVSRLLKFEINILDDRLDQLLSFLEDARLPGTSQGQPRIAGPPKYQADFDALRDAVTYAELCRGHWFDECYPEAPKILRMPLDHPPLLHAVRREMGDVLVPSVNPFPWKLQIDDRLQDVRITNPHGDPNTLQKQIVLESGIQTILYKLPVLENSEIELKQDAQGNLIFADFETEKRWYMRYYERRKQLVSFINASGKAFPYVMGMWSHGADGPNFGLVKAKKRELAESVRDLTVWMVSQGLEVPEWPYKGGAREVDVSMVGT